MNFTQVLLSSIVRGMEEISFNKEKSDNNETSSKAGSQLSTVSNFQFLVSLVVTRNILDYIRPAIILLQRCEIDLLEGYNLSNTLIKTLTPDQFTYQNIDTRSVHLSKH